MGSIMDGEATPAQIAGFLVALRTKGETADEIAGFAEAMREHVVPVTPQRAPVVDIVGTGGDGANTFNISTAAALVAAAAGAAVAKHGNRAASSAAGSADVLEELGIDLEQPPERIAHSIDELGFGFMFARAHHPAMRFVAPVRQEIGIRTVFNVLGPLANPAGACDGVFGVYSAELAPTYAEALAELGARRAFVVHGARRARRALPVRPEPRLRDRRRRRPRVGARPARPRPRACRPGRSCAAARPPRTPQSIRAVLAGEQGARRDAVLLNAAAGARRRRARRRPGRGPRARRRDDRLGRGSEPARRARRLLGRGARLMGRFDDALAQPGLGAIAEIKRRSPSAGDLRPDADPAADRPRLRRRGSGRDLGARRRALRRHLGRPPGGPRRDDGTAARQGLLLDRRAPADREGGRCRRGAAPPARSRRRRDRQADAGRRRASASTRSSRRTTPRSSTAASRSARGCSGSTRATSRRSRSTGGRSSSSWRGSPPTGS